MGGQLLYSTVGTQLPYCSFSGRITFLWHRVDNHCTEVSGRQLPYCGLKRQLLCSGLGLTITVLLCEKAYYGVGRQFLIQGLGETITVLFVLLENYFTVLWENNYCTVAIGLYSLHCALWMDTITVLWSGETMTVPCSYL